MSKDRRKWGSFPELSEDDNETILEARACGFDVFFPSFPGAKDQAENTLKAARQFLERYASRIDSESASAIGGESCPECGSAEIVSLTPVVPGPSGWGRRCKKCGHVWSA